MLEGQNVRLLRRAGSIGVALVIAVLILQVGVLLFLSFSRSSAAHSISESGLRRTFAFRILYDDTVHDAAARDRDTAALLSLQARFDDLSAAERTVLNRFVTHPDRADAQTLFTIFDERTLRYESSVISGRQRFRTSAIISGIVALLGIAALYLFLIRPVEVSWEGMLNRLEERRERFAAIFTESPDAMAMYRTDGTIARGNAAAIRMLGYGDEVLGVHWSMHIVDADRPMAALAFERALKGHSQELETQFRAASGQLIPVLCSLSPITVRGKTVGVVGIAKDLSEIRASEAELERSRARFASMFDFHPDAIAVIDRTGRITRANVQLEILSQYRAEELIGMPIEMLATAQDSIEHSGLAGPLFGEQPQRLDAALRTRSGTSVVVRIDTVPMRVGQTLDGMYVIARDVTAERELEFRERVQRERLRSLAHLASEHAASVERQINELLSFAAKSLDLDGAMVTRVRDDQIYVMYSIGIAHPVGTVVPLDASFTRHVFATNQVLSFTEKDRDDWADDPAQLRERWSAAVITTAYADGVPVGGVVFYSLRARGKAFTDADRDFVRVVASMVGASLERERREEELEAIAYADPLTRLPNRRYVLEHLQGAIARAERAGESVVVYYIDLDGFKEINDRFGHAAGDQLLVTTAARFRQMIREGDVLARVGGDEFLVVQSVSGEERAEFKLASRLLQAAAEPVPYGGNALEVTASIGIVVVPQDAANAGEAVDRADEAMYCSKRAGKGMATLYVPSREPACPSPAIS